MDKLTHQTSSKEDCFSCWCCSWKVLTQEQLVHIITQIELLYNQIQTLEDNRLSSKAYVDYSTETSRIKIDFFLYKACFSFDNIKTCTIHSYLWIWYWGILYSHAVHSTLKSFDAVCQSASHLNTGDAFPHSHIVIHIKNLSVVMVKMHCFIFIYRVRLYFQSWTLNLASVLAFYALIMTLLSEDWLVLNTQWINSDLGKTVLGVNRLINRTYCKARWD